MTNTGECSKKNTVKQMSKTFQFFVQVFYSVVLFAAATETSGLLAGACFFAGLLNVFGLVLMIIGWLIVAYANKKKVSF